MNSRLNTLDLKSNLIYWLIGFYILLFPFQKILFLPIVEHKIQLSEIIFLGILISFGYEICKKRHFFTFNFVDKALVFWLGVLFLCLIANFSTRSFIEFLSQGYLISLYYIIKNVFSNVSNDYKRNYFINLFKWSALLQCSTLILGIYFVHNGIENRFLREFWEYPYFGTVYRFAGFSNEPVMLASILSVFLISILGNENWSIRNILILIVFGISIIMTLSKSLAIFFLSLYILYRNKINLRKISQKIILVIVIGCTISYLFMSHIVLSKESFRLQNSSYDFGMLTPFAKVGNYYCYKTSYLIQKEYAIKAFINNPIFGVGLGGYINYVSQQKKNNNYPKEIGNSDPLSTYTGLLAEAGLIGFISFLIVLNTLIHKNSFPPFFSAIFIYFIFEAVCTDILNFRHYWILLAYFSSFFPNFEK